jgi:Domain of unknown function (DUF4249)
MKIKNIIYFVSILIIAFSCTKDIEIELPESEEKIVVEGWIEQNQYPVVVLTTNTPYFDKFDSTALMDVFISDAKVTVSDGTTTEHLSFTIDFQNLQNADWPMVYFIGDTLKGEIGKTYTLNIEVEGKILTAFTTIPQIIEADSIWFKLDEGQDSLGYLWGLYSDDPNTNSYFRFFTKRLSRDNVFTPTYGSIVEDKFFSGDTLEFSLVRGIGSYTAADAYDDEELGYYKIGDTVVFRLTSIDQAHYNFWRTAEQEIMMGQNPFSSPVQIRSNIEGGLGVWGGYAADYDTLICE